MTLRAPRWVLMGQVLAAWSGCRWGFDNIAGELDGRPVDGGAGDGMLIDGPAVDASAPNNRMFVTSTLYPASSLTSAAVVDAICAERAEAGDLAGTFRAMWSDGQQTALVRLAGARGWRRTDGKPFIDELPAAVWQPGSGGGKVYFPPRLDEFGQQTNATFVATATDEYGETDDSCATNTFVQGGRPTSTEDWLGRVSSFCGGGSGAPIYCFGVDSNEPLVVEPAVGRQAFLAPAFSFDSLLQLDARCSLRAGMAGLQGSFKAWIATDGASASSRFDATGPTWVRLDGIALAPTAADVLAGNLEAPLNLTLDATYIAVFVAYTGAASPTTPGTAATTCENWTTPAAGSNTYGDPHETNANAFDSGTGTCNSSGFVYCLEE